MPAPYVHFRFAMGEYQGEPSYLVQSAKGLLWLNLPDELCGLLRRLPSGDICDFSLGSSGKFYIKWKEDGTMKRSLSRGLWQAINQNPNTLLDRLSLGAEDTHWGATVGGTKSFFLLELSLRGQIIKAESAHRVQDFRFVSLGADSTYCYNLAGTISTRAKDPRLKAEIKAAKVSGRSIMNVVLSPESTTSWLIMYADGTHDGMLPGDWWKAIEPYFQLRYSLLTVPAQRLRTHPATPKPITTLNAPIRMLTFNSVEYHQLRSLFFDGWKHPHKQLPSLVRIYAIDLPDPLWRPYLTYRLRIESDLGSLESLNERKTFHGTPRKCCIGDPQKTLQLCSDAACNVCSIIRTSFRIDLAGTAPGRNFMRFGRGLYTTSVSSKADDYSVTQANSPYKAMLVAKVVLGRGYSLMRTTKNLIRPPVGHDSVLGTVGVDLNYDEQVVYRNDAIRPAYLLLYEP
ncbi:hypothetical protein FRB98_005820 [Tulasnella sp. 332]|nr:hypothetical protein FRB98_005820 [Tulasnella sp. 332]